MNPNYPLVAQRAAHQCEYCHAPEIIFNIAFEVEHIIPLSKNGSNDLQNLALACRICNLRKLDFLDGFDPVTQERVRLFHPRRDRWEDHFLIQRISHFQVEGNTAIGRVTIERLNMNSPLQTRARESWISLGLL